MSRRWADDYEEESSDEDGKAKDEEQESLVSKLPSTANYFAHEEKTVDTNDREDHTFCGVMVCAKRRSAAVASVCGRTSACKSIVGF